MAFRPVAGERDICLLFYFVLPPTVDSLHAGVNRCRYSGCNRMALTFFDLGFRPVIYNSLILVWANWFPGYRSTVRPGMGISQSRDQSFIDTVFHGFPAPDDRLDHFKNAGEGYIRFSYTPICASVWGA